MLVTNKAIEAEVCGFDSMWMRHIIYLKFSNRGEVHMSKKLFLCTHIFRSLYTPLLVWHNYGQLVNTKKKKNVCIDISAYSFREVDMKNGNFDNNPFKFFLSLYFNFLERKVRYVLEKSPSFILHS